MNTDDAELRDEHVQVGQLQVAYSSRGIATYRIEVLHRGLSRHRVIKGNNAIIVERKAALLLEEWTQRWRVIQQREAHKQDRQEKKDEAASLTEQAQAELTHLHDLLSDTLAKHQALDWERLKDRSEFSEPGPVMQTTLPLPSIVHLPREPLKTTFFDARLSVFDRLLPGRARRKRDSAAARYEEAHATWRKEVEEAELEH